MADGDLDEDDYLSNKFLVEPSPEKSSVKTYSTLRKEAQRKAQIKHDQHRKKSRREREIESRHEGLSKSLFEVERERQEAGVASGSKALSIMMRMGFKPGDSLGKKDGDSSGDDGGTGLAVATSSEDGPLPSSLTQQPQHQQSQHRTQPIPLNEWSGKKGIGLGTKRALSPSTSERVEKMAKMAEESKKVDFRERARREYQERRAQGQLGPAQRTCATLDEKCGTEFNVLWLNPDNPEAFPEGLIAALTTHTDYTMPISERDRKSIEGRLREQMARDTLLPQSLDDDDTLHGKQDLIASEAWSLETLEEVAQFLCLQAQDRLQLVLSHLRSRHHYCFWCGTQYSGEEEMSSQCPGETEEEHD